ncbi:MAG: OprO/OprP family phosphate-selective porin [Pseudomonadota bacterium]
MLRIGNTARRTGGALLVAIVCAPALQAAEIDTTGGLSVADDSGEYTFSLGGRVMWDTDTFDGALNRGNDGDTRFDTQLRRARIEMSGELPGDFEWVFDTNVDDDTEIHAAGIGYTGWDVADVFVGRTKEPFGLEELTSSKAISSIERNYYTEATDTDSQAYFGARLDGAAGPVGWSFGLFNPAGNPQKEDGGDRIAVTGRIFGAPIHREARVLHLGAAYSDRNLDAAQPLHGFQLDVAESGGELDSSLLETDDDRQWGLEALYLQGPFSLQGEMFRRDMTGAAGADGEVNHGYLQATWTITGESRGYKANAGVPGMVTPARGSAALELVAKVDRLRFDVDGRADEDVDGYLLGANYYPNRNVRLMLNVIRVTSDGIVGVEDDDDATVISTRIQLAL